jgi:hypothetical protein
MRHCFSSVGASSGIFDVANIDGEWAKATCPIHHVTRATKKIDKYDINKSCKVALEWLKRMAMAVTLDLPVQLQALEVVRALSGNA